MAYPPAKDQKRISDYFNSKSSMDTQSENSRPIERINLESSKMIQQAITNQNKCYEVIDLIEKPNRKNKIQVFHNHYNFFPQKNVINIPKKVENRNLNVPVNKVLDDSFFNKTIIKNEDSNELLIKRDRSNLISDEKVVFFKDFELISGKNENNIPLLKYKMVNIDRSDKMHLIYEGDSNNKNNLDIIIIEWTNYIDKCELPIWNVFFKLKLVFRNKSHFK